jgi:hypothetical protein
MAVGQSFMHQNRSLEKGGDVLDGHEAAHHPDEERIGRDARLGTKPTPREGPREVVEIEAQGHDADSIGARNS